MGKSTSSVAVIGLGYIGLPTAAVLASRGVGVIGVDVNPHAVETINRGQIHIVEPGLLEAVEQAVTKGLLVAQTETPKVANYIIAVPTPFKGNHEPDLSYIEAAAENIAPHLEGGELLVLESTSPPGATAHMADVILKSRPDLSLDGTDGRPTIHVAHCPERVLPGKIMTEMYENDRIVGGLTVEAAERAKSLYEVFCEGEILLTDAKTAEMSKLVENAYRDVNIAFANELSVIADSLDINVWELITLANHHPRVNILQPGPGVGGHCIAVDPWFIVSSAPDQSNLIRTARQVNDDKPKQVLQWVADAIGDNSNPAIAVLGLAFKADIDDLRESPALAITETLGKKYPQARIFAVEPNVHELPTKLEALPNITLSSLDAAIDSAEVVVLLVDHKEFSLDAVGKLLKPNHQVIDTRGKLLS